LGLKLRPSNSMTKYETLRITPTVKTSVPRFAVAGMYSENVANFAIHAALIDESSDIQHGKPVALFHMCPPLVTGSTDVTANDLANLPVDIVSVVSLTSDELRKMEEWRHRVSSYTESSAVRILKGPFRQYLIHPHKLAVRSELGRLIYFRYSCVGLVIDCYEAAGIATLELSQEMPEIDEDMLRQSYPEIARLEKVYQKKPDAQPLINLGFKGIRELGLGERPWRPILVGYLFHSLSRFTQESPRPPAYHPESVACRLFPTLEKPNSQTT
jgi:hypothetical protein